MSKKKIDVKEEAGVVEAQQDSNLVSIEMTPEQRDDFVKFMAQKKELETKEVEEHDPILDQKYSMSLVYRHNINGVAYGPGQVVVPHGIHSLLQYQEQEQKKHEIMLNTSTNRMFKILESGQSIPVPVKK